jgi:hypothetical protein
MNTLITIAVEIAIVVTLVSIVWTTPKARAGVLQLLDVLQANKERVVAVLTPTVFAPAAAAIALWVGRHFPGVDLPTDQLVGLGVTGFLGAVAAAITWLRGAQKESDNASAERIAALQSTASSGVVHDAKVAAASKVVADTPAAQVP